MAISTGRPSLTIEDIKAKTTEADIITYYLNLKKIPCFISSPLRKDVKPSFGLYANGERIFWTDLATNERGGIFDLLSQLWNCNYQEVLERVYKDIPYFAHTIFGKELKINKVKNIHNSKSSDLQCKIREWRKYDIEYWKSYGISLEWLKYAEVYPISYKIVISEGKKYVFSADKLAYAFVERKENKVTLKIYQPLNKNGYKWSNKHDKSVISLWTKIPKYGDKVVICSSLKDALCLWENTKIPALAVQGEGYNISNTAISELKKRYNKIYILFDNDKAGLEDGKKLALSTGFINLVLPQFTGGKDVSDLYKTVGKNQFIKTISDLFKTNTNYIKDMSDLPF